MKNIVFWDVMPCDSCKKDVSEEGIAFIIRETKIGQLGMLAVTRTKARYKEILTIV
jgi:hypothetical protein